MMNTRRTSFSTLFKGVGGEVRSVCLDAFGNETREGRTFYVITDVIRCVSVVGLERASDIWRFEISASVKKQTAAPMTFTHRDYALAEFTFHRTAVPVATFDSILVIIAHLRNRKARAFRALFPALFPPADADSSLLSDTESDLPNGSPVVGRQSSSPPPSHRFPSLAARFALPQQNLPPGPPAPQQSPPPGPLAPQPPPLPAGPPNSNPTDPQPIPTFGSLPRSSPSASQPRAVGEESQPSFPSSSIPEGACKRRRTTRPPSGVIPDQIKGVVRERTEMFSNLFDKYLEIQDRVVDRSAQARMCGMLLDTAGMLSTPTTAPYGTTGFVYCLQSDAYPDLLKIGRSKNVTERLAAFNTGCAPMPLRLVAQVKTLNAVRDEKRAHAHFASVRKEGEYFRTTVAEVQTFFNHHITPTYLDELEAEGEDSC